MESDIQSETIKYGNEVTENIRLMLILLAVYFRLFVHKFNLFPQLSCFIIGEEH